MIEATEIYHNGRTYAEHSAWLDSLRGDEYRIVHMPIGHLFNIAFVSFLKQGLLTIKMTAGDRLRILDSMATVINGPVTAEAVTAIEPDHWAGKTSCRPNRMRTPIAPGSRRTLRPGPAGTAAARWRT